MALGFVEKCIEVYGKRDSVLAEKRTMLEQFKVAALELDKKRKEAESKYFETFSDEDMTALRVAKEDLQAANKNIDVLSKELELLSDKFYVVYDPELIYSEAKEIMDSNGVSADIVKFEKALQSLKTLATSIVNKYNQSIDVIDESIDNIHNCKCTKNQRTITYEKLREVSAPQYWEISEKRIINYSDISAFTSKRRNLEDVKKGAE